MPPVPVPSAHSSLLVASASAGLGAAGTVTRGCGCSSWPLMSLGRGPGAAPARSVHPRSLESPGWCPLSCQGCLGGLARVGLGPVGFSSPIQAPDWSWLFSRDGHVPPCAWEGPGMDRMGSPVSGCPRGTIKGTLGLFRSYPIQTSAHSLSSVLLHFQDSSPPVFHQFSCPCSIPSSCVGTLRVNFSSSIPIPSPMRSFSSAP